MKITVLKNLDIILLTLDEKINGLKIAFDNYKKISLSASQIEIIDDFEYLEKDIKSMNLENIEILDALNFYIQKRVEAVTTMSLIVKYCLSHDDFLKAADKIIIHLEETYDEKSGYKLMYSDCYLNSSLAALNTASKHDFIELLKIIIDTTGIEIPGIPIANLHMRNVLTFKVLTGSLIDTNKIVGFLKEDDFDTTAVILKAVQDAFKMKPPAADNFVNQNKEWLQVDINSNLAILETDDWTILDHVNSPVKKLENTKNLFHENLIKEYSDILKIFKDTQTSKSLLDLSSITEDFESLAGSAVNLSIDPSMKESLNLSNMPLFIGIEDIIAHSAQDDMLKLIRALLI